MSKAWHKTTALDLSREWWQTSEDCPPDDQESFLKVHIPQI